MRSIGKQFSHTVRFQHEELVDAKSSTSKILPLVIVAVYLVTACHATLDLKYSCHVICLTLTSYSCHVISITSRWEILRYFFNPPPPLHPNGLLDRVLPPICSLSLPPSSLFGSNVHVYIFLRASKVEGNNFRLSFWVHSSPLVTRKPKLWIIQTRNAKHG